MPRSGDIDRGNQPTQAHPVALLFAKTPTRSFETLISRLFPYPVYFETAFSSVRAWSIWSYAYVAMAVVVIVSPSQTSDS